MKGRKKRAIQPMKTWNVSASFAEVQWSWKAHSGQILEGKQERYGAEEEWREPDLINS